MQARVGRSLATGLSRGPPSGERRLAEVRAAHPHFRRLRAPTPSGGHLLFGGPGGVPPNWCQP
eukprot:9366127-Lingulodinium_polyedra.AAC.1